MYNNQILAEACKSCVALCIHLPNKSQKINSMVFLLQIFDKTNWLYIFHIKHNILCGSFMPSFSIDLQVKFTQKFHILNTDKLTNKNEPILILHGESVMLNLKRTCLLRRVNVNTEQLNIYYHTTQTYGQKELNAIEDTDLRLLTTHTITCTYIWMHIDIEAVARA